MLVGYFVPQFASLKPLLPYILTLMLYNSLLDISIRPKHFFQKKILFFPLLNWILLPIFILFTLKSFPPYYQIGLLVTACSEPDEGGDHRRHPRGG